MKLKSLKEYLAMSKEKIDEELVAIRARRMEARVRLKTAEIEEHVLGLEKEITEELTTKKDFDLDKLIDLMDKKDLLEMRGQQAEDIASQLFPK